MSDGLDWSSLANIGIGAGNLITNVIRTFKEPSTPRPLKLMQYAQAGLALTQQKSIEEQLLLEQRRIQSNEDLVKVLSQIQIPAQQVVNGGQPIQAFYKYILVGEIVFVLIFVLLK